MGAHSHQNAQKVPQSSIRSPQNPRSYCPRVFLHFWSGELHAGNIVFRAKADLTVLQNDPTALPNCHLHLWGMRGG